MTGSCTISKASGGLLDDVSSLMWATVQAFTNVRRPLEGRRGEIEGALLTTTGESVDECIARLDEFTPLGGRMLNHMPDDDPLFVSAKGFMDKVWEGVRSYLAAPPPKAEELLPVLNRCANEGG